MAGKRAVQRGGRHAGRRSDARRRARRHAVLGGAALAFCAATVVTATQLTGGGDPDTGGPSGVTAGEQPPAASAQEGPRSPSPSPRARPAPEPRVIPAVRAWEPGRGPGWEPGEDSRVVADPAGPLADEARRLAGELGIDASGGPARAGDVELAVDPGADGGREAYTLTTGDGRVRITGSAEAGVFYGTRTLLQTVRDRGYVSEGEVRDRPDRPQRGLLIDTARKHFPADWIEDRVREMADLKLNQLHLHFADDQGFRIESDSHPEIVSEQHLTKDEVRGIIDLARSLHVTVVPEIDSPGHLGAVLKAHPDLQLRDAGGDPVRGAIDITDPRAAGLVDELLDEFAPLFPGRYFHLGGDEYAPLLRADPAASFPALQRAAVRAHGPQARIEDLATAWLNDRAATVTGHGKTPQVWNDGMHADGAVEPSGNRQVTYWTGREIGAREPVSYLEEGWDLLNLNSRYLYYVLGEPNEFTYPTGEAIYEEWTPDVLRGSEPVPARYANADRIPGGRFAVWCDLSGAQSTAEVAEGIRLPLAATAQKLWDPAEPELSWSRFTELADRVD
ncbi:family 20 glycosylhydrolase [Streptomyces sp. TRM 70351]|uniref:family 20 glycosylhydrolase n=1 Tax=Streptomyces sp. TRM 70351 TaxID=3116552 RepID=UPI002E7B5B16|nr:family 20 glycosylhydrolase [Streptomyces sp. TRM 70351]MEE1927928.1 family 20 glycosylhydrolase [Streptomyces sp. TRM 70351]